MRTLLLLAAIHRVGPAAVRALAEQAQDPVTVALGTPHDRFAMQLRYYDVKDLDWQVPRFANEIRDRVPSLTNGAAVELRNGIAVVRATRVELNGIGRFLGAYRAEKQGGASAPPAAGARPPQVTRAAAPKPAPPPAPVVAPKLPKRGP